MRSQDAQNGSVTESITPISPCPSTIAPAGRRLVVAAHGLEGVDGVDGGDDLAAGHDLARRPAAVGVEGHELDEAHDDALGPAELGEGDGLVLVHAAAQDDVELHRVEAGLDGGVDAGEHGPRGRRVG